MEVILVLSAAFVNFILGAVWYAIFGKHWVKAWNLNSEDMNKKDPVPYLIAFIGSLWSSYGLFLLIKHVKPHSFVELLTLAIGTWLLIVVGLGAKHYAFAGIRPKAFLIDYGLDLIGIIVMCSILTDL
jgi:hypothetical protein